MSSAHVERLIEDHGALIEFLREGLQPSFVVVVESSFPKIALLAAASDLENKVQHIIIEYYERLLGSNEFAVSFVRNKAVSRQFHTYFDWSSRSANHFFGLFGSRFKEKMKKELLRDDELARSVKTFCEIGDLRNQLVHQNYAAFTMQNTVDEISRMYHEALLFMEKLPQFLDDYDDIEDVTSD